MSDLISRQATIDVVHHTIYEFFDVVEDDDESPLTHEDKKLLELNKAINTRIQNLPSARQEVDPEWRKEHYKKSYAQGFVDGCKSYEKQLGAESWEVDTSE